MDAHVTPSRGAPRKAAGRNALLAAVLSGLGPGAGHAYVGRPVRGLVLVLLLIATSYAWIVAIPSSYSAARAFSFPPMLLILAIIVDSARLARRARGPLDLARWQHPLAYVAIVALTGFALPTLATAELARRAMIVSAPDDAMAPRVLDGDWVVVDRLARGAERGDVVAIARAHRAPAIRRVVGLPGETVSVRLGTVDVKGAALSAALARPLQAQGLTMPSVSLGSGDLLVLGDRRGPDDGADSRARESDVLGRASWVLFPSDHDFLRVGAHP